MIGRGKHGWIGIDFGTKVVKLAQLTRAEGALRWRRAIIPRSSAAGRLTCTGQELRETLELHGGFHGRTAACTLPMSAAELRVIAVPPASDAERRAMIAQELEAAATTNEPCEFDFWQAGAPAAGGAEQDGVQVLSVPSAKVAELTESLAAAGLECAMLDGLPCALARAAVLANTNTGEGPVAAIDWGHDNACLTITDDGRAQFTRPLRDCGAGALFQEVGRALGLDEAEAIELLTRFGLPAADEAPFEAQEIREVILDIVAVYLQRMVEELARTLTFFRLQRQSLLPRRACLFGAGATVKNAAAFLAAKLETPCDVWRVPAEGESQAGDEMFGPAAALSALAWK